MGIHIKKFRQGFKKGYNLLVPEEEMGMEIGLRILEPGKGYKGYNKKRETCVLLLEGTIRFSFANIPAKFVERKGIFTGNPTTFLVPRCCRFQIEAFGNEAELIEVRTENPKLFKPTSVDSCQVRLEWRGSEKLGNRRLVKTIFDLKNAPKSNIVIGEVVASPGNWSSYPSHHHIQPEIYFYRFMPKQGFGSSYVGNQVFKVEHNDAIKIASNLDHPQATAPGYKMWYLWIVRHLPNNPYTGFKFEPQHEWILEKEGEKK